MKFKDLYPNCETAKEFVRNVAGGALIILIIILVFTFIGRMT